MELYFIDRAAPQSNRVLVIMDKFEYVIGSATRWSRVSNDNSDWTSVALLSNSPVQSEPSCPPRMVYEYVGPGMQLLTSSRSLL